MAEIDKVFAGLDTRLRRFKEAFAIEFLDRVKRRTPVRTGKLQRSWGATQRATDVEIYNVADYASYVEYGTERMEPRGMLRATLMEVDQIAEVAAQKVGLK